MSGCDDDDIPESGTSVNLNDLTLGYQVTDTGGLAGSEFESYIFCGELETFIYSYDYNTTGYYYYVEGNVLYDDEIYVRIDTEANGTPGRLEEGTTYIGTNYQTGEELTNEINAWTITSIEEVECTPNPT